MNVNVPAARAWPNCPPEFYRFFLKVASSANETSGGAITDINNRLTAVEQSSKQQVQGFASIQTQGGSSGYLYVTLQGDVTTPGNTQYYGTDSTGKRGWFNVADALGSASLGNLGDVSATAPTDKYVLTWDATTSTWGPALSGGLPAGGTTGQVLTKLSATDGDADWEDASGGIESVVGGSHISVDSTDPANPVVAVSGTFTGAGYPEGASFPSSPALNDKYYRTDLNLLCYFDGTRWLTVQEYTGSFTQSSVLPITGNNSINMYAPVIAGFGMYITRFVVSGGTAGTANSSNYWNIRLQTRSATSGGTGTDIVGSSVNTSTWSTNNFANASATVNAVVASSATVIQTMFTMTGSPGTLFAGVQMFYRLIVN